MNALSFIASPGWERPSGATCALHLLRKACREGEGGRTSATNLTLCNR
jgi:hypothetical protein